MFFYDLVLISIERMHTLQKKYGYYIQRAHDHIPLSCNGEGVVITVGSNINGQEVKGTSNAYRLYSVESTPTCSTILLKTCAANLIT